MSTSYRSRLRLPLMSLILVAWTTASASADDWMTWASTYTHEPVSGTRIDQYALPQQPLGPSRSAVQRSGYRHFRSTLQAGLSADNLNIVEQWGGQVVPYEHWRFPYRPYGVPYDAWGPQAPYGIINSQFSFGGYPGYGYPGYAPPGYRPSGPSGARPGIYPPASYPHGAWPGGHSRGFPLQPEYRNQPWFDGTYPPAAPLAPQSDAEFFYRPGTTVPAPGITP